MFGSKKTPKNNRQPHPNAPTQKNTGGLNSLVQQTRLEGTINADSDFRVDGFIKGTLNCTAKVIIGPTGTVEGNINCQSAVIEGSFTGDLIVRDSLVIKESAKLNGDVRTSSLTVQPGAVFNVICKMTKEGPVPKSKEKVKEKNDLLN